MCWSRLCIYMGMAIATSQLPFASNKCWSKGKGNIWIACSWTRDMVTADAWPLMLLIRREEGFCLEAFPRGLQRPLRECKEGDILAVKLGKEPVWQIHCPSNPIDSKVAPVKKGSWRGIWAKVWQTHLMEERRLWMPSVTRTGLQSCDGFPQEAGRWNLFKACKEEGKQTKTNPRKPQTLWTFLFMITQEFKSYHS